MAVDTVLRHDAQVLPSVLASSSGSKQLLWRNDDTGQWTSLCKTDTAAASATVWAGLCQMDGEASDDRRGLDWQEALPVVKRLRLQLKRARGRVTQLEARQGLSVDQGQSRDAPIVGAKGLAPVPASREVVPLSQTMVASVVTIPRQDGSAPDAPALVRVLKPEERPVQLWGPGGLCGPVAPPGRTKLFVNLTTGLELFPRLCEEWAASVGFCHIRSTHLERSAYENLVRDLDCELLFLLACGVHCVVLDAGSARGDGVSRAIWQGLDFIRYLLSSRWLSKPTQPTKEAPQFAIHAKQARPHGPSAAADPRRRRILVSHAPRPASPCLRQLPRPSRLPPLQLSDSAKRKVDYYRKFLSTPLIRLSAVACASLHDGDDEHYAELARRSLGPVETQPLDAHLPLPSAMRTEQQQPQQLQRPQRPQ